MTKYELAYLAVLATVEQLGPIRLKLLLDYFGRPSKIWQAKEQELVGIGLSQKAISKFFHVKESLDPESFLANLHKQSVQILTVFDKSYPASLKQISDPPVVLFVKGKIALDDQNALAVVGSRKMTYYGREVTERLTRALVGRGVTIVSGLARGVDICAHQAAIAAGGRTIAVLGSGINNIYPPEHLVWVEKIIDGHGAVISEFAPDYPPLPNNFPARNRIISGLSLGVLVTEASLDSGSLITARLALDQGREVFAIPGPITSPQSHGPASLIKHGAKLVTEAADILEELHLAKGVSGSKARKVKGIREKKEAISDSKHSQQEQIVLVLLENEAKHIDMLVRESGLATSQMVSLLSVMEIKGLVKNLDGGQYQKSS